LKNKLSPLNKGGSRNWAL